jgi:hypothetical protein
VALLVVGDFFFALQLVCSNNSQLHRLGDEENYSILDDNTEKPLTELLLIINKLIHL